jgi:ABC-type glycerol-3-phosphate transport system permease component
VVRATTARALRQLLMVAMVVASLFPIYFIVATSLKSTSQYIFNLTGLPHPVTLANFANLLQSGELTGWIVNSTVVTLASIVIAGAIAILAAYAIARERFFGREVISNLMIALMVVPPVILIIPMFLLEVQFGLINTFQGVILFYVGLLLPFSVYLLTNFFEAVPKEIVEAAAMDGTTVFQTLRLIMVPMARPAIVTLMVVNATWVWNELLIALVFLQNDSMRTLMAGLTVLQGRYVTNEPLIMAGAFIAVIPMLLMYAFGQRYFVEGMTAGTSK